MKKPALLWITALVVTLMSAAYQRLTGDPWPDSEMRRNGNELLA
ncbi:hypothetical protein ACFL4Q_04715 [candidate division KSB1 bacterium]